MRTTFVRAVEERAERDPDVYILTADLGFRLFDSFRERFPDRFINVGVAEPNMIGIAAGLAMSGKTVFCYSIIPFLILRTLDQIRVDLCYQNLDVRLIGVGGGLTYGLEGMTHHAIEDLAVMRSLPNMTVVAPGDPWEARSAIEESFAHRGPLFIRLGKNGDPNVHIDRPSFRIGKGIVLSHGRDVGLIATGSMLHVAALAKTSLEARGIRVTLVSMHTVKPLDEEMIRNLAGTCRSLFTVEEHSLIGGLGSAVAEILAEAGYGSFFQRIALPDLYGGDIGNVAYLREKHGLSQEGICRVIIDKLAMVRLGEGGR